VIQVVWNTLLSFFYNRVEELVDIKIKRQMSIERMAMNREIAIMTRVIMTRALYVSISVT